MRVNTRMKKVLLAAFTFWFTLVSVKNVNAIDFEVGGIENETISYADGNTFQGNADPVDGTLITLNRIQCFNFQTQSWENSGVYLLSSPYDIYSPVHNALLFDFVAGGQWQISFCASTMSEDYSYLIGKYCRFTFHQYLFENGTAGAMINEITTDRFMGE